MADLENLSEESRRTNKLDARKIDAAFRSVTAKTGCATCGKQNVDKKSGKIIKLKLCSGCHTVAYCSRSCQTKHWKKGHKKNCAVAKKKRETIPTNNKKTPSEMVVSALKMIEITLKIAPSSGVDTSRPLNGIMTLANASGLSFSDFMISEMIKRGRDLGDIANLKLTIDELELLSKTEELKKEWVDPGVD